MMSVGIAILAMIVATVAVHLGLPQAISKVLVKVLGCYKCLSFWTTLIVLQLSGFSLQVAIPLSFLAAYISGWFAILLGFINKLYDKLWQRMNK